MSKERARTRNARQAQRLAAQQAAAAAQRRTTRLRRFRQRVHQGVTAPLRREAAPRSALQRQRARQNGTLLSVAFALNVAVWLLSDSWVLRIGALVATVALWPMFVVLFFDRRTTR